VLPIAARASKGCLQIEWVWPRENALHIIYWLNANGYSVTGIGPWLPTQPGPTPLINDWYPGRKLNSAHVTAKEFVETSGGDYDEDAPQAE
jgi:uncharacterized protein YfaT (DUF1175 family)